MHKQKQRTNKRCILHIYTHVCVREYMARGSLGTTRLSNVRVHFDCAGSHKVWSPVLVCGILPVNSRTKWLL